MSIAPAQQGHQTNASHAIFPFHSDSFPYSHKKSERKASYPYSQFQNPRKGPTKIYRIYRTTSVASFIKLSLGQYGHLNRPPLLSLPRLSLATTWPHGIIIGGFASVVCSLLTGHTNIAWNIKLLGNAISTGNSFWVVHSVRFSFWIVASFSRVGRAIAPAVVAR